MCVGDLFLSRQDIPRSVSYLSELPQGYWSSDLPNPADDQIAKICQDVVHLEQEQRTYFASLLDDSARTNLSSFAFRMSMVSVRQQDVHKLQLGLIALVSMNQFTDRHEFFGTLAVLHCSANKLDTNPENVFQFAAEHAVNADMADRLLDFQKRSPAEKSLQAMLLRETYSPHGIVFWNTISDDIPRGW